MISDSGCFVRVEQFKGFPDFGLLLRREGSYLPFYGLLGQLALRRNVSLEAAHIQIINEIIITQR